MDWQWPVVGLIVLGSAAYLLVRIRGQFRSKRPSQGGCGSCSAPRTGLVSKPLVTLDPRPGDPGETSSRNSSP